MILRPRLAPEVVFRRLSTREESYVIVKNTATQKFYKFEVWEEEMLKLLDGTRAVEQIDEAFRQKHPEKGTDLQWTVDYLEVLKELGLMERTDQERHLIMMDKVKTLRKRRFYDAESSTLFRVNIPLFDPNRTMDKIIPYIRFWWSPWFVGCWLVIFAVVLGYLVYYWNMYWAGFFRIWSPAGKGLWDWIGFLVLLFGVSIWHELGHAFSCKRYGGEVHDIGFMIFYLQPAFYCNVDDSYIFPKQSHRLAATFGGPYFELMLCCVAAAAWLTTPAEWWIHSVAHTLVFFTGLSAVLMNINPLVKLDGYYVLMDWLDVPDLREESFQYIGNLFKKHVFHLEVPPRAISRRRRRIYLIYGLCAILYTTTMLSVVYLLFRKWLVSWFGPAGYLVLLGILGYLLRKKLKEAWRFAAHLWLDKAEWVRSRRGRVWAGGAGALLVILLLLISRPTRIDGSFVVEPAGRTVVRAPVGGIVREIHVAEGSRVSPQDVLAVLESPELEAARYAARSELVGRQREAIHAMQSEDLASFQQHRAAAQVAQARLDLLDERAQALFLRSGRPGVVSTPRLDEKEGAYLRQGDAFCTVDQEDPIWLAVEASEAEISEIHRGLPARILLESYPERPQKAAVLAISPVAVPPEETGEASLDLVRNAQQVRVLVQVPNPGRLLRTGMSGRIQFLTTSRTTAGKIWWHFRRWAGSLIW